MNGVVGADQFPHDVRSLLAERIESYEQLELLLLLRNAPKTKWTPEAVAPRLGISTEAARAALDHLTAKSLVHRDEDASFRYAPIGPELVRAADGLARAYEEKRVEVMMLMNANAIERVRTAAIRTFADAFIFRKKNE